MAMAGAGQPQDPVDITFTRRPRSTNEHFQRFRSSDSDPDPSLLQVYNQKGSPQRNQQRGVRCGVSCPRFTPGPKGLK